MTEADKLKPVPPTFDAGGLRPHWIAEQFPAMDAPGFEGLKVSIRRSGILDPIVLYGGAILDGRHRHRAAMELGLRLGAAQFREFVGSDAEAEAYADAVNAHRRHLTAGQREARVRAYLAKHPGASNREAARACGVSHNTVKKLKEPPSEREYQRVKSLALTLIDRAAELSDAQRARLGAECGTDLRTLWSP